MARRRRYTRWNHTAQERRVIRKHGGIPKRKYGTDGTLRGRPVEVRSIRKDDRYRIQQNIHRTLVRRDGRYIFVRGVRSKVVPARRVSRLLRRGPWFRDRKYPHKFLAEEDIWW